MVHFLSGIRISYMFNVFRGKFDLTDLVTNDALRGDRTCHKQLLKRAVKNY